MFILKKEHQPGVYVPLRALFLVFFFLPHSALNGFIIFFFKSLQHAYNIHAVISSPEPKAHR